jgi:hypothetical protein
MRIACIGSREITPELSGKLANIGRLIAQRGWFISSGNADGSDCSYARGANEIDPAKVIIYLPWKNYNPQYIVKGNLVTSDIKPEWIEPARRHHAIYDSLGQGVQKLMCRNIGILWKADACIAVLNHAKKGYGGTGQGWRYATELGIPKLDVSVLFLKQIEEVTERFLNSLTEKK